MILLSIILVCFSAAGFALASFDQRYALFVGTTFGIGALFPSIYVILLLIKTITPKKLLVTSKRYILRKVLQREDERLQRSESIEEPLFRELDDREESENLQLLGGRDAHRK